MLVTLIVVVCLTCVTAVLLAVIDKRRRANKWREILFRLIQRRKAIEYHKGTRRTLGVYWVYLISNGKTQYSFKLMRPNWDKNQGRFHVWCTTEQRIIYTQRYDRELKRLIGRLYEHQSQADELITEIWD